MKPEVKICGLTRPEDVECALENGADYLGFIVEAKSARKLTVADAAALARPAVGLAWRVAVTVNADNDLLQAIHEQMKPDFIQCHGDESPHRVAFIKGAFHVPVIKAIPVKNADDLKAVAEYSSTDRILLDAKAPKGLARGGHGVRFDWGILKTGNLPERFLLAGGLTPENVAAALKRTNASGFDVSSGVEVKPGVKDAAKIEAFTRAMRHG